MTSWPYEIAGAGAGAAGGGYRGCGSSMLLLMCHVRAVVGHLSFVVGYGWCWVQSFAGCLTRALDFVWSYTWRGGFDVWFLVAFRNHGRGVCFWGGGTDR